jgi:hypothetical protein
MGHLSFNKHLELEDQLKIGSLFKTTGMDTFQLIQGKVQEIQGPNKWRALLTSIEDLSHHLFQTSISISLLWELMLQDRLSMPTSKPMFSMVTPQRR